MEMTQFTMVEELAHLVKDNLFSKHLVLSTEEALVDFLQNDISPNGVLELEPMTAYHRLLLHRLAEIFGFCHESVGEGDDRHLVLERCSESSIPSILVSDILWDNDNCQPATTTHILRRKSPLDKDRAMLLSPSMTVEEKEAAYLAARERIFALHEDEEEHVQSKPRNVPVVAQRMIAHALGQRISSLSHPPQKGKEDGPSEGLGTATEKAPIRLIQNACKDTRFFASRKLQGRKVQSKYTVRNVSSRASDAEKRPNVTNSSGCSPNREVVSSGNNLKSADSSINLEREQAGAAKRIFAHALGLPCGKGVRCGEVSKT